MDKQKVIESAMSFFTERDYEPCIRTDDMLVFRSDEREYSLLILIVLFFLGIVPAIVYYMLAPRHQVSVSFSGDGPGNVTVWGNTDGAKEDIEEFNRTLT